MGLAKPWMEFRKRIPEPVKRVYRLGKLGLEPIPTKAPSIPQALIDTCKFISDRETMLEHLPQGGKVLEIGVLHGVYTREILKRNKPKTLDLLDLSFDTLAEDVKNHESVTLYEGVSELILPQLEDGAYDWIYIDADHTYHGVQKDITLTMSKVKPGGYLVFNDFARINRDGYGTFGVHQAVCEFMVEHNWPMAFFCFQGEALYDVALKKPG
ncbi:MAG: class I SAM-dependent methyltransferase [Pseudomonadota bacterium]